MAREEYDPNDFLDQLAAMAEANFIASIKNDMDLKNKNTFDATLRVCEKYGIKGLDAIRFIAELGSILLCMDSLDGDNDADS